MDLSDVEKLIERIMTEKGVEAIPNLIQLLADEDENVRETVLQIIYRFGDAARPILLQKYREHIKMCQQNDVILLYLIDILSDLRETSIKKDLYNLLNKYDDESAQLVIYEAICKLGEGEKILDILAYYLLEDEYREELATQVVMALSYVPTQRTIDVLMKAYRDERFSEDIKKDIVQAISMLTMKDSKLWDYFQKSADSEILAEVKRFTT
ncbi:HEAT repeat domain-containing protein [Pseudothermotoga sp.]|nr:HEAT repeat domain-containing protein [Pseudothermotoga sp.]MCX7813638.1 HEAT repeat domain-containing protein [Pseudothermotoga sp.]MDW8139958.1 HEAT repeat domain-containing protein [Pseudothermotoga sp.]